ncbi:MAG: ribosome small subunit-dependent GTPase A, partial [Bacillota bacterium]
MADGMRGVIVKGIGGFYYVHAGNGQVYTLRARGVFRRQKITPLIGDAVTFTPVEGEEEGWIDQILPRQNVMIRPPVANVTCLMIVVSPKPKPDLLLVDSLLVEARRQRITPVLVINKSDLEPALCEAIRGEYENTGDPVMIVSAKHRQGLAELEALLRRGICCFAGQSGVGKSTLVTAMTGMQLGTGEISKKIGRGKHTTRHTELLIHNGFQVLDT